MPYLPINVQLEGAHVVVVGGGRIALQKARVLAAAGAALRVVAPRILPAISALPGARCHPRPFREEDLDGALLAIAATDDRALNLRVYAAARARRVLVNVVDDPTHCDFIFPSILRRGELAVSVSTAGAGPALARMLREELEAEFPEDYGAALTRLRELRRTLRRELICPGAVRAGAEALSAMAARARRPDRLADELARMQALADELTAAARGLAGQPAGAAEPPANGRAGGRLTLVGAGPGDPDLITVAGRDALRAADVVIYDRLVHPELLRHAPASAVRVYLGKRPGEPHQPTQDRIHDLIVEHGRAGRHVVRLKGGDPMLFGRGGEELEVAARAGIPARVIPGVTAALGAAAAARLPLTHRELASSVAFVTGCGAAHRGDPGVDWAALARAVDTIVIYMGVEHLTGIAAALVAAGRPAGQPVALVCRATLADEAVFVAALGDLAAGLTPAGVEAPAAIIVGEVARCREASRQVAAAGVPAAAG